MVVQSSLTTKSEVAQSPTKLEETISPKGVCFWLIFLGICLAGFVSSTDATIIFVSIPTITKNLDGQENYIWFGNAYVFATTAVQPFFGQISNIFGRRHPMIFSVALFALGSGITGGANSSAMFIAVRLVQGVGAGGMIMPIDLIVCDLVPLPERTTYLGIVLGHALTSWKWGFWIKLPVCAVTLAIIVPFLRVSWKKSPAWRHSLARIDYLGNAIFIASITSILLGLIQGGVNYPWASWRTILPIALGWIVFVQQDYCVEPTMPLRPFAHRTSATSQLGTSPLKSGIDILPINEFMIHSAGIAGALLTKTGKYKPLHSVGFSLLAIATGLFSTMTSTSTKAAWVSFQILAAIGIGFPLTTQLPAIQAVLPESDTAISTSIYSFIRSLGFIWGARIPSIIFNSRINATLESIPDADVRAAFADEGAYAYANNVKELSGQPLHQTLNLYANALRTVWYAGLAFSLLGLLVVFFFGEACGYEETLNIEFGLEDISKQKSTTDHDINTA
ncbi:multidrug resistance protein fnx1 [Botrytis cinerea]